MSHVVKIKVMIRDLEALRRACARLGLTFHEGQRTYRWYGTWMGDAPLPEGIRREGLGRCDHAISVPAARYEVGVVRQGDHYTLLWDSWPSGGLEAQLGTGAGRLVQAYTVEASIAEAARQGYPCWEEAMQDGSVRLHVETGE